MVISCCVFMYLSVFLDEMLSPFLLLRFEVTFMYYTLVLCQNTVCILCGLSFLTIITFCRVEDFRFNEVESIKFFFFGGHAW